MALRALGSEVSAFAETSSVVRLPYSARHETRCAAAVIRLFGSDPKQAGCGLPNASRDLEECKDRRCVSGRKALGLLEPTYRIAFLLTFATTTVAGMNATSAETIPQEAASSTWSDEQFDRDSSHRLSSAPLHARRCEPLTMAAIKLEAYPKVCEDSPTPEFVTLSCASGDGCICEWRKGRTRGEWSHHPSYDLKSAWQWRNHVIFEVCASNGQLLQHTLSKFWQHQFMHARVAGTEHSELIRPAHVKNPREPAIAVQKEYFQSCKHA